MKYRYQKVDRTPATLVDGVVYHNEDFELAALSCACGCGHRITLLVPDSHQVFDHGGFATVRPSIGVFDAPCLSHFFVTAGDVEWLDAFSQPSAAAIMQRQIARHVGFETKRATWFQRLVQRVRKLLGLE
jgi:hypothetical protein